MKKIQIDLSELKNNQKLKILDMHNDPEWALSQLESAGENDFIVTVQSSFDEFIKKINSTQKDRFEKVKYRLKKVIPVSSNNNPNDTSSILTFNLP